MDEKLFKPIIEVNYLSTENTWRYRAILRFFYQQHERLRHYLFPEEILQHLQQFQHFKDYSQEQLQHDLNQLVDWKNLVPRQDMGKVSTIEEFKKKRFRYQCTPYTIEIERLVTELEKKGDAFGGSLERSQFDRLMETLLQITDTNNIDGLTPEKVYFMWDELFDNFRKLTENATDYLAYLESEKVEEMMLTEAFLAYKDSLTEYLRSFMTALQRASYRLESLLEDTSREHVNKVAEKVAQHYLTIPRLDNTETKEELVEKYASRWSSLVSWFLGEDGRESDMYYLQKVTNETVRRITRYAQRLGEKHHNFKSRRKDYIHLASWFLECDNVEEAHRLSACVFGVSHTRHLYSDSKLTEDVYKEVWDEPPTDIKVNPRIRNYREKTRPGAIISHRKEKQKLLEEYIREKQAESEMVARIISNKRIALRDLKENDRYIRKVILNWISKCMNNKDLTSKTENGYAIRLAEDGMGPVTLQWEDGVMELPGYIINFE